MISGKVHPPFAENKNEFQIVLKESYNNRNGDFGRIREEIIGGRGWVSKGFRRIVVTQGKTFTKTN